MKYFKAEKISIKAHPDINEKWIQDRIAEDPSILGLGDVVLKDRERIQPGAGRLDLLLQEVESLKRYEVEVQLGKTDESHVIRTIEYWDIERKRYPQYDHCAVIVAEDITSRFLNVIGLFAGHIPLMAIQMECLKVGDDVTLVFTKVIDEYALGLVDDDEEVTEVTDRAYWEKRSSKVIMALTDELFGYLREIDAEVDLKYNKFYIGLSRGGTANNFVSFIPRKSAVIVLPKLPKSDTVDAMLENAGLDLLDYEQKWRQYRVRLNKDDLSANVEVMRTLFKMAYENANE